MHALEDIKANCSSGSFASQANSYIACKLKIQANIMGVPLLDASQLHAGPEARKSYLRDLIQSFQDYGFTRLKNHGIPANRVKQMFDLVR